MPPIATVKDEDYVKSQKGLYILGKDIREIPCLRSSLLLGITCGTFVGLISFMVTSKAAMSSHIGFGSVWLTVFAYWIPCRYNYEVKKTKIKSMALETIQKGLIEKRAQPLEEPEEEKKE